MRRARQTSASPPAIIARREECVFLATLHSYNIRLGIRFQTRRYLGTALKIYAEKRRIATKIDAQIAL